MMDCKLIFRIFQHRPQAIALTPGYKTVSATPNRSTSVRHMSTTEHCFITHATQIGLPDCSRAPLPGHVSHIGNHLTGIVNAPGAPVNQVQRATEINNNLNYVTKWLKQVRNDALQLVVMNDATL